MSTEVEVKLTARVRPLTLRPNDILLIQFEKPDVDMDTMEAVYTGFLGAMNRAGLKNEVVLISSGISARPISPAKARATKRTSKRKVTNELTRR